MIELTGDLSSPRELLKSGRSQASQLKNLMNSHGLGGIDMGRGSRVRGVMAEHGR